MVLVIKVTLNVVINELFCIEWQVWLLTLRIIQSVLSIIHRLGRIEKKMVSHSRLILSESVIKFQESTSEIENKCKILFKLLFIRNLQILPKICFLPTFSFKIILFLATIFCFSVSNAWYPCIYICVTSREFVFFWDFVIKFECFFK